MSGSALSGGKWARLLGCHPGHKEKLVVSVKALQKQYVSLDTVALAKTEMPTPCAAPWRPCSSVACVPSTLWGGAGQEGCPPEASASACLPAPPESYHPQTHPLGIGAPDPCQQGQGSLPGPQPRPEGVLLETAPPGAGPPVPGLSAHCPPPRCPGGRAPQLPAGPNILIPKTLLQVHRPTGVNAHPTGPLWVLPTF